MIIFGTRGLTYTKESGSFYCPCCSTQERYCHKRVRRFFTLYFIPLIPLEQLGEYVECEQCKNSYKLDVLNYDPKIEHKKFEAEYYKVIKRVMLDMVIADGQVEEEEVEAVCRIYNELTGTELSPEVVKKQVEWAKDGKGKSIESLDKIAGSLNDNGKEMVIKAAFLIASADGDFHEDEKKLIVKIGKSMDMSDAHIVGVIKSMV